MARVALGNRRPATPPRGKGSQQSTHLPEWEGPPPGTFDPGLEAEVRKSERELLDLIHQSQIEGHRSNTDVAQKRRELERTLVRGRADLARQGRYTKADAAYRTGQLDINFTASLTDLGTAKMRGEEDYARTLADMQHRNATQLVQQREAAVQHGVEEAGSNNASDRVRGANLTHEQALALLAHNRDLADLATRGSRDQLAYTSERGQLQTERDRQLAGYALSGRRLGQDTHTSMHALSLAAARAAQDRAEKVSKAKREQALYSSDVAEQAYYQAHQNNPSIIFPSKYGAPGTPAGGVGSGGHGANPYGVGPAHSFAPTGGTSYPPQHYGY